ncbi:hypothetical protein N7489_004760 [Penicillium chrysogenum]|uniref:Phosphotransferase n=1 Tax=Penicillium chrysogenum TaxID=5076 RepID=A0ABQ8WDT1_PENCH|nr:uncharacterized protein N7489_004760 [Penicillium chrysogenum]KAJ5842252.1 hypothetical protein N7534_012082 [Penicillium rubens]KAJ5244664.1 hypothetical protein N7489_004760 [Penicillium chrysogenum]KAJ5264581.1 hypothetical protein N7505_007374 [Penicillium chrysogenum]KAJ5849044.1 hypothetical protein N7534_008362 [Penicillium rubens]KAJ5849400.1 hypothetical protein N7534_008089 [Penicillium rubens]
MKQGTNDTSMPDSVTRLWYIKFTSGLQKGSFCIKTVWKYSRRISVPLGLCHLPSIGYVDFTDGYLCVGWKEHSGPIDEASLISSYRFNTVGRVALKQITDKFVQELYVGLSENGGDIPMNPTWVMALPTGKERGVFPTFEMGGTDFRVCKVELLGSGRYGSTQVDTKIPDAVKSGTAQQLWLFIIDCLRKFLKHHPIPDHELRKIPLAFTFSYPVTQASVRDGVLQRWTKAFDISGIEGHNVPAELQRVLNEMQVSFPPLYMTYCLPKSFIGLVSPASGIGQ